MSMLRAAPSLPLVSAKVVNASYICITFCSDCSYGAVCFSCWCATLLIVPQNQFSLKLLKRFGCGQRPHDSHTTCRRPSRWCDFGLPHIADRRIVSLCHQSELTAAQIVGKGTKQAAQPGWKTVLLGLLAGAYVGFGALLMLNTGYNSPGLLEVSSCSTQLHSPLQACARTDVANPTREDGWHCLHPSILSIWASAEAAPGTRAGAPLMRLCWWSAMMETLP